MSQIAAQAKVGRTAVYNHFSDKEDLLLAFIAFETQRYTKELRSRLERINDPLDQIRLYVRSQLELKTQYQVFSAVKLGSQHGLKNGAYQDHGKAVSYILESIIEDAISQGVLPKQDLEVTIPLVHATLGGWRLPANPAQREHLIRCAQDFILRALGSQVESEVTESLPHESYFQLRVGGGVCPVEHSNV